MESYSGGCSFNAIREVGEPREWCPRNKVKNAFLKGEGDQPAVLYAETDPKR